MCSRKSFIAKAVVLTLISAILTANAELVLTLNGIDTTIEPIDIKGKEDLVIAVAGANDTNAQDISVTCDTGKLEQLSEPSETTEQPAASKYLFYFSDEGTSSVNLEINGKLIYQLVLFYNPETKKTMAFGLDSASLSYIPPEAELTVQPVIKCSP